MRYGMPYMGSKNDIAKYLIDILPSGERFVDLFGGGAAMTHAACLSNKWKKVYYNELNPLVVDLFKRSVSGEFSKTKPEWISREKFKERRDKDGMIAYVWSFGNNGKDYLYSKEIEDYKRAFHEAVCFGEYERGKKYGIDFCPIDGIQGIKERRLATRKLVFQSLAEQGVLEKRGSHFYKKGTMIDRLQSLESLQSLERLQNLQNLESLERLQSLESLEINRGSYTDYKYRSGDVVYCDPPYEGTAQYDADGFDSKAFYDWVASRPYRVFFSSYDISDTRFVNIWERVRNARLSPTSNTTPRVEKLYCNRPFKVIENDQYCFDFWG